MASPRARLWIGAIPVALVAVALLVDQTRMSPGPITAVHAREHEWSLARDCGACHGSWFQSMEEACLSCHEDIEASIETARGLHGSLDATQASDCARCHGEHHGPRFGMVSAKAFALAGVEDLGLYDHPALGYGLTGAHDALGCERCHTHAWKEVLPLGTRRFGGLDQTCSTCHEDQHEGRFGSDCAACHGQERPFVEMDGLTHDAFCPLEGAHARYACADCHVQGTPWAVETLALQHVNPGSEPTPTRSCAECHPHPHEDRFLEQTAALARQGGADPGFPLDARTVCGLCHSASHESFAGSHTEMDPSLHAASGFALDPPHGEVRCEECHEGLQSAPEDPATLVDPRSRPRPLVDGVPRWTRKHRRWPHFEGRFPGRKADTCVECHGDPHDGEFAEGPFAEGGCLACHERLHFAPVAFGLDQHAETGFALDGSHAEAACTACHPVPGGGPTRAEDGRVTLAFAGTPDECTGCHHSPHRQAWIGRVADLMDVPDGQACAVCHRPEHGTFLGEQPEMNRDLHVLCGMALDSPHDKPECVACHEGFGTEKIPWATEVPDPMRWPDRPREFKAIVADWAASGRVDAGGAAAFPGAEVAAYLAGYPGRDAEQCKACHGDPHEGQFEGGPFGGEGCRTCHDQHHFYPPAFGLDEHERTQFPLTGSHEAVSCFACHAPAQGDAWVSDRVVPVTGDRQPSTRLAGTPTACEACHADTHKGLFDGGAHPILVDGRAGCARCHDTTAFARIRQEPFEHEVWTGYSLAGAHAEVKCEQCHVPRRVPDNRGRRYGFVKGIACADCHQSPHVGQFIVDGVTDCKRCHVVVNSFQDLHFDHQTDSRFPLDENHAQLECGACHQPYPLKGGGSAMRYKPLGTHCNDCHAPGFVGGDFARRGKR